MLYETLQGTIFYINDVITKNEEKFLDDFKIYKKALRRDVNSVLLGINEVVLNISVVFPESKKITQIKTVYLPLFQVVEWIKERKYV